jgi:hypothetical protein
MFKAGMDESHEAFVMDNNSRETYETWEACLAEGVRTKKVEKELPERVQTLHDESLTQGRDVLKEASPEEKQRWLSKSGTDWSGAFGDDPEKYVDASGKKRREPGADAPMQDGTDGEYTDNTHTADEDSDSDLGIVDASGGGPHSPNDRKSMMSGRTEASGWTAGTNDTADTFETKASRKDSNRQNKRTEERKQRGLMQWKPARNLKFAKDEGIIGIRRFKSKLTGGLEGRQPGVETETGT